MSILYWKKVNKETNDTCCSFRLFLLECVGLFSETGSLPSSQSHEGGGLSIETKQVVWKQTQKL